MNNNLQQLKELALRYSKELKNMSDDELKARFIESFGIDKWNEEEMLAKLIPFGDGVANYLGIHERFRLPRRCRQPRGA